MMCKCLERRAGFFVGFFIVAFVAAQFAIGEQLPYWAAGAVVAGVFFGLALLLAFAQREVAVK